MRIGMPTFFIVSLVAGVLVAAALVVLLKSPAKVKDADVLVAA